MFQNWRLGDRDDKNSMINHNFKILKKCKEPFNYVIMENFLSIPIAKLIYKPINSFYCGNNFRAVPDTTQQGLLASPQKYYVRNYSELPYNPLFNTLNYFSSLENLNILNSIIPLGNIVPDPTMEGGGVHITKKGGYLNLHTDFKQSASLNKGLTRVSNLLIYLTPDWNDPGGDLLLKEGTKTIERISPEFNKAVYFETNNISIHGHPEPIENDLDRISLAFYYYKIEPSKPRSVTWY